MSASDGARIAAIQQRHNQQRTGIVTAVELATRVPREVAEVAAHHALMAAADALRGEARAITDAKTKGHVSMSKELTTAAARVAGIAVKIPGALTTPPVPSGMTAVVDALVASPCTCTIDSRDGSIVDREDGCRVHGVGTEVPPARGPFGEVTDPDGWMGPAVAGQGDAKAPGYEVAPGGYASPEDGFTAPEAEALTLPSGTEDESDGSAPMNIGQQTDADPFTDPADPGRYMPEAVYGPSDAERAATAYPTVSRIPGPRASTEALQPATVAGIGGQPVPALYIGETITAPVPSLTDPFADPGGRLNVRRLTYGEFVAMARTLVDEPSKYMSVTKVQGIGECGMRYAFGRLANRGQVTPERPQWHNVGGNAFHAWVADLESLVWTTGFNPSVPTAEVLEAGWLEYLDNEVAETLADTPYTIHDIRPSDRGREGYDWWRVNGADMCRKYLTVHDDAFRAEWETVTLGAEGPGEEPRPAIEVEYHLPITSDADGTVTLMAHGFMDIIRRHRTSGIIRIEDHKSGKSDGSDFQLASYAHAARRVFGMADPILVTNWMARKGEYTDVVEAQLRYAWDELVYDYTTAAAIDRQGLFVAHPTSFCGGCPFEAICPKRYGQ